MSTDIENLANTLVEFGPSRVSLLRLIEDWSARVLKLYDDRSADPSDGATWTLYDLIGSYHLRTVIGNGLSVIDMPNTRSYFPAILRATDELLKDFTYEESEPSVLGKLEMGDGDLKSGWWWRRIPADGPLRREYDDARLRYYGDRA